MPNIFISRVLKDNSPFLSVKEWNVVGMSLLEFSSIENVSFFPEVEVVFFYGKKAVDFSIPFLDNNILYACMGKGTANHLEQYGFTADFIGEGKPEDVAKAFKAFAMGKTVLFPRARHSEKSIQTLIEEEIEVLDLVVYENTKKQSFPFPAADVLIFTSPMNAEAYFEKYELGKEQVVAIGQTTQRKLKDLGVEAQIADTPSERSLFEKVKEVLNVG